MPVYFQRAVLKNGGVTQINKEQNSLSLINVWQNKCNFTHCKPPIRKITYILYRVTNNP